ncbi:hypothetical protein B0H15DRAFT_799760 [Mycena belliarum]|uniref:Uncharacterized protein n=1 Tax=Mycena belliarum TaxID=1033014 RepID=A0AAD6U5S9_9AGAR|nr:hypothetical protein B0H15DRAFT_799760 [Mycena belliae]
MAHASASRALAAKPGKPPARRRVRKHGKKPGKVSWVHGTKLEFFSSRADAWMRSQETGGAAVTKFYDDLTKLYLMKYGYDMKDDEDLDTDIPDPTDPNAPDPEAQGLGAEEAVRRAAIYKTVRGKIGAWYRSKCGGGVDEGERNFFMDLMSSGLDAGAVRPQKPQLAHFYSHHYYEERVKARYDLVWATEVQRAKDLDLPPPRDVKVRGEVTRKALEEEEPEFRAEVQLALDREYAKALKAWEIGRAEEPSRSAEELNASVNNSGFYLQPIVDAVARRFKMNVSMMVCGPVGDPGGAIEVRRGLNPQKWHQFDRLGFREAEVSMIKFSERSFTVEERTARIVEPAVGEATSSGTSSGEAITAAAGVTSTTAVPGAATVHVEMAAETLETTGVRAAAAGGEEGRHDPDHETPRATPPASPHRPQAEGEGGRASTPGGGATQEERAESVAPCADHTVWHRTDMRKWPAELRNAYSAFALGTKWGKIWADCVETYLEVEAACGYRDEGPRIGGERRPEEMQKWISGGRKWFTPPKIAKPGNRGEAGTYTDEWWAWWISLQPPERMCVGGMLTTPTEMSWGKLPKMCGRNGFMQVMASLFFWGMDNERRGQTDPEWEIGVDDVHWLLNQLLLSGELASPPKEKSKDPRPSKGTKRKRAEPEGEVEEPMPRKTRAKHKEDTTMKPRETRSRNGLVNLMRKREPHVTVALI